MKTGKENQREKTGKKKSAARRQEKAYGGESSICLNAGCVMRKKARCFGFEGCPGFRGR